MSELNSAENSSLEPEAITFEHHLELAAALIGFSDCVIRIGLDCRTATRVLIPNNRERLCCFIRARVK